MGISRLIDQYAPYTPLWNALFEFFLLTLAPLSIGLGLFNLIPIPPLDGSKVVAVFLPDDAYAMLMRYERYGFLVLLALSYFGFMSGMMTNAIIGVFSMLYNLFF